jgi:hypothetical protein
MFSLKLNQPDLPFSQSLQQLSMLIIILGHIPCFSFSKML